MKRVFRQRPDGSLVEIDPNATRPEPKGPAIWGDIPEYESPIDGRIITSRSKRREDLRRSGCRPYEGFEVEAREAARHRREMDKRSEQQWAERVEKTYYQLRDGMMPRET